jgi:hypothetical protein
MARRAPAERRRAPLAKPSSAFKTEGRNVNDVCARIAANARRRMSVNPLTETPLWRFFGRASGRVARPEPVKMSGGLHERSARPHQVGRVLPPASVTAVEAECSDMMERGEWGSHED